MRGVIIQNHNLAFEPQVRLIRIQALEEEENVFSVGRVAEAIVELVIVRRDGPDDGH